MFNSTYNPQPKEDILGGLLLAASVCWTIAALTFLPAATATADTELAVSKATPAVIAQADGADRFAQNQLATASQIRS